LASLVHPRKFQPVSRFAFVTAATSLTRGQPNCARSLAVSWAGTLYIHFRGFCPLTEFCPVQSSVYVQVLRSPILAALLYGTPAAASVKLCGEVQRMELQNFRRGRYLYLFISKQYSAGRPSRWAPAHILALSSLTIARITDKTLCASHFCQWVHTEKNCAGNNARAPSLSSCFQAPLDLA